MHAPPAGMAASLRAGGLGLAAAVLSASKWREASSRFSEPDEDDAWDFDACCDEQAEVEPCIEKDFGYDTCGFEDGEAEVLSSSVQSSAVQLPLLDSPSTGSSQVCGPNYLCTSTLIGEPIHLYKHFFKPVFHSIHPYICVHTGSSNHASVFTIFEK